VKKLMLLAALLAMVIVAAVPAIAQVTQSNEQGVSSGDAKQTINVTGGGANSNQCAGVQGVVNTGNATSNTSVLQYANDGAGVGVSGGNFEVSPSSTTTCKQQVNQAASASG
jgi:hypothetical protein